MNTLYLDPQSWDLVLDTAGNIALAKDPYAKAQDVASACRLFAGELYYDTEKGIPYFEETLGKSSRSRCTGTDWCRLLCPSPAWWRQTWPPNCATGACFQAACNLPTTPKNNTR